MGRKACVSNFPTLHESIHVIWALLQESPQIAPYPKCTTYLVSFSYLLGCFSILWGMSHVTVLFSGASHHPYLEGRAWGT